MATDTALVAGVLGWEEEQVYMDPDRCGKLAETWVYQHPMGRWRNRGSCVRAGMEV